MKNSKSPSNPKKTLEVLSEGDPKVLGQLGRMLEGSFEESGLDSETFMLTRVAALAATDAPPASWLMNLKVGRELGVSPKKAVGTLVAIAPVIGTSRTVSAAGSIIKALAFEDMAESANP